MFEEGRLGWLPLLFWWGLSQIFQTVGVGELLIRQAYVNLSKEINRGKREKPPFQYQKQGLKPYLEIIVIF